MILKWLKRFLLLIALGYFLSSVGFVQAQSCSSQSECQSLIEQYTSKLKDLGTQSKTLSNQIAQFNTQIALTTVKISQTEEEIKLLGGRIDQLEASLSDLSKAFSQRAVETYKIYRSGEPAFLLLNSGNISEVISNFHYLAKIQESDRSLMLRLQKAQNIYVDQKTQQEILAKQLDDQKKELNAQKAAKDKLLAETKGSEAQYQKLLSQAQAQLASFSRFAANQGGASLLDNQTSCDDWGCYYNQRDRSWGGLALNGTKYSLASDGCLVTAMAMMMTYYGHKGVTPITINSNPNNFASYYPAYLNYTIYADGATAQRTVANLDATLSSGNPLVVGVNAYGGTHFVVLKSGSNGNYVMNDPFLPNGKDKNFTDYYSVGSIFEINKVSVF